MNLLQKKSNHRNVEIDPDEVLIDASNVSNLDRTRYEGRLERPISRMSLLTVLGASILMFVIFLSQIWKLQISNGDEYSRRSAMNILRPVPVFGGRGVITDRNGVLLAWNAPSEDGDVSRREYASTTGLAHILGYVQYPSKDSNGFYYREDFEGVDGVEKFYNAELSGRNGSRLVEVDATGHIVSENTMRPPENGDNIRLSIDSRVQSELFSNIKNIDDTYGFAGGAGVIMDVNTGEMLALTSYPEFSPQIMSDRNDQGAIQSMLNDKRLPFLDRAIDGLYVPGSTVKPYIASGVLNENVIDPNKIIHTKGYITVQNPYDPNLSSMFRDWKDLGDLDIRHAIAMSSDAYFYTVGGGYGDQKGLGIAGIDKYLRLFGFGEAIPEASFLSGKSGTIPTPEWKKKTFDESWYLGDTYHTAIGQYGTLVTPSQMVRAIAAIANGGHLLVPTIVSGNEPVVERTLDSLDPNNIEIVREGMRLSATIGTGKAMNVPYTEFATKTGTAELGVSKEKVNSWVIGFWPYKQPKYAFAVILEQGSVHNLIGAVAVLRATADWMSVNTPEYFK
ncbi:MAG: penicillin-binding transpeptidase domain-containing protein [Patescibacteria group bacterium]|nr:penicillin-binding transpeptidase domain-containing protein [Patescibacteria group bacterium]